MAPDEFLPENWMNFPGSQPVSLDRQNLALLGQERYGVTWKADGTRYMLLIQRWGAYLVDRSFKVRPCAGAHLSESGLWTLGHAAS